MILKLATKHGKSAAQIVLRWHLQKGNVVSVALCDLVALLFY